ncbi:MAG: T9SS type A sorting domain-containing protein [Bacteroidota bacterium]
MKQIYYREVKAHKVTVGILSLLLYCIQLSAFAQQTSIFPSTQHENATFGYHIAHDGNWLLVGAKNDTTGFGETGAAYFFKHDINGWSEFQKVGPDIGAEGDWFGLSVAISGNYAVVAANGDDTKGFNVGAAYIYKLVEDSWVQTQKLFPNPFSGIDEYGIAVSMKNDLLVVGAYSDKTNGPFAGAAYIYKLTNGTWQQEVKILPDDGAAEDRFGRSVHTDGKQVIICGVLNDDLGTNSGSAYIYIEEEGTWIKEIKLLQPDGAEEDRFGRSVGIGLEYAAVGSVLDDDNGSKSGAVIIYHKESTGWEFQQKITPDDGQADDFFGYGLSLYKNHLVVTAHNDDDYGLNSGKAYLFKRTGTTWTQIDKFYATDPSEEENFGESVYIDESWISIGAPYGLNEGLATGSAVVFPAPVITDVPKVCPEKINIYPNPAQDYLNIDYASDQVVDISITNVNGLEQKNIEFSTAGRVDISFLSPGVYILRVEAVSKTYFNRFIKVN